MLDTLRRASMKGFEYFGFLIHQSIFGNNLVMIYCKRLTVLFVEREVYWVRRLASAAA
jgi:hypothetical protein